MSRQAPHLKAYGLNRPVAFVYVRQGVPALHLCCIDESGTPEIPGDTSHFVLAGVSIPIQHWRQADSDISAIKARYGLQEAEIHTAWLLRKYLEQSSIVNFEQLARDQRRAAVNRARTAHLLELQKHNRNKACRQAKKLCADRSLPSSCPIRAAAVHH